MFGLIRKAIRRDKHGQQPAVSLPVDPPSEQAMDDEIPRYPPFMKGLPATHPDKLIETQRELIGQIREAGLASSEIFEQFYRQSLRRFASYAHLLPASQTHHHRGAGGCCVTRPKSPCGRSSPAIACFSRRAGAATPPRTPATLASGGLPRRPLPRRRQAGHRPGLSPAGMARRSGTPSSKISTAGPAGIRWIATSCTGARIVARKHQGISA
jgi:hypothetical protein